MRVQAHLLLSGDNQIRPAIAAAVFLCPSGGGRMQRRGGPPRKDGERHPNGQLRHDNHADHGTPELQHKRAQAARGDDPKFASHSLGRLYAARVVLQGDRWAGDRYALLFTLAVRPVTIASMLGNLVASGMTSMAITALAIGAEEDVAAEARRQYLAAREVLGPWEARAVESICVYQNEMLERSILAGRAKKALDHLTGGLDKLHRHFEEADRRSKATRDLAKRAAD